MNIPDELRDVAFLASELPAPWNAAVLAALELAAFLVANDVDAKTEIERLTTIAAQAIIDED